MIDQDSKTWATIKRWAEDELAKEQKKLESPHLDFNQTNNARGAITRLRQLVALPSAMEKEKKRVSEQSSNEDEDY